MKKENRSLLTPRYDKGAVLKKLLPRLRKGESVSKVVEDNQSDFPSCAQISTWMSSDRKFRASIELAREIGGDYIAADCLAIADASGGGSVESMVEVQHRKLMVDTRLRLLALWHPKRYGNRIEINGEIVHSISPLEQLRALQASHAAPLAIAPAAVIIQLENDDTDDIEQDCI
jgi:hypothetical protein